MAKILTDKWHLYPPPPSRPSLKNADLLNKSLSLKNCNLSLKIGEKSLKYFCLKLYEVKAEKAVLVWCGKSVKFGRVDTRCAVWIRFAPKSKFGSIRFGTRKVWRLNQALGLNPHRSLYFWNRIRFYAKRSSVHSSESGHRNRIVWKPLSRAVWGPWSVRVYMDCSVLMFFRKFNHLHYH